MPIAEVTVKQLFRRLVRRMEGTPIEGTATAGSSNSLDDTNVLAAFANDEDVSGWVVIDEGTGIGQSRAINGFSQAADRITPSPNWTTSPDTTSKYVVTRRFSPDVYLDAIDEAIRRAQDKQLFPLSDLTGRMEEVLTFGDILSTDGNVACSGQFEDPAATFPSGWTLNVSNGTATRDTDVDDVRRGDSSLNLTGDGTNLARARLSIKNFAKYAGTLVSLRGKVKDTTSSGGRTLLRVDDGVTTAVTDLLDDKSAGVWDDLEADLTLDANPIQLDIDLEISAGAQVTANFDDVRLIWEGGSIYEYDLNARLVYVSKVEREVGSPDGSTLRENAWVEIPREAWTVKRGKTPKLVFDPERFNPPKDVHMRITGQCHPATLTRETPATMFAETIEADIPYVMAFARWYLLSAQPDKDETARREMNDALADYLRMEEQLEVPIDPGSELVQP